jgi:hypothetical protein
VTGSGTGVRERVVEDVQCLLAGRGQREAVTDPNVLDEDEKPVVPAIPQQRDGEVFVPAMGQLGHLRPPLLM